MTLLSLVNLVLQIVVLVILVVGIRLVEDRSARSIKRHLYLMAVAVILILVSMILVMVPSLLASFTAPPGSLSALWLATSVIHGFFGGVAFVIGVAFVFNKKPKKVGLWMRIQASLWFIAFLLGLFLYLQAAGVF
nr:hypothetical protein [Candidatus Njordarchaeum guaymaensis]